MSKNADNEAVAARNARRRHLQQRQTVIFGGLIAAMLAIGLTAGAMWVDILPSPINVPINSSEPEDEVAPFPCPPDGQLPLAYTEIAANVLNGTSRAGLAASTATSLATLGVSIGTQGNSESSFPGTAKVVTGPLGVSAAYTVAALFDGAVIELDARSDATVDIIVGATFTGLVPADQVLLDPTLPIPAPEGCAPVAVPTEG